MVRECQSTYVEATFGNEAIPSHNRLWLHAGAGGAGRAEGCRGALVPRRAVVRAIGSVSWWEETSNHQEAMGSLVNQLLIHGQCQGVNDYVSNNNSNNNRL